MAQRYAGGGRSRPARLSEGYLEEEADWEDGGDGDDDDEGRNTTQRARESLRRNKDVDERSEVGRGGAIHPRGVGEPLMQPCR